MGMTKIIALDLGKFKTVACVMNVADRSHVFVTIEMSPAAVHELLARHATDPAEQMLVVLETCDCCGWVYDLCVALGLSASWCVAASSGRRRASNSSRRMRDPWPSAMTHWTSGVAGCTPSCN